jgi:hypothetical protein
VTPEWELWRNFRFPGGERAWNERPTAMRRENAGLQVAVRERLWNQAAKRKTTLRELLCVNAAVAARERVENTGPGIGGGRTLRSIARQGAALAARLPAVALDCRFRCG